MLKKYLLFGLFFYSGLLFSQSGKLSIFANIPDANIYLDSTYLGKSPIINFELKPGKYIIRSMPDKITKWNNKRYEKTLEVKSNDSLIINISFGKSLRLFTRPEAARISINNTFIGYSPLNLLYKNEDTLFLDKKGYKKSVIPLNQNNIDSLLIDLSPDFQPAGDETTKVEEIKSNTGIYYLIGGGLTLGTISILTKIKADNLEDEYNISKDQDVKKKIRIYDTISGFSLLCFEACFLTLSYLLLRD